MPNGNKRTIKGRPILRAGRNVGKRNVQAQKSGRPVPPDQLGFFSGKSMGVKNKRGVGRATDFSIVNP